HLPICRRKVVRDNRHRNDRSSARLADIPRDSSRAQSTCRRVAFRRRGGISFCRSCGEPAVALERCSSQWLESSRYCGGLRLDHSCPWWSDRMKIDAARFKVKEGNKVWLHKWPTYIKPVYKSKKNYKHLLQENIEQLSSLQRVHYANDRYAVLLIFQAMDAAGKDGVIRHVMSGINPQGCEVFSFKHPSATELDHDFLWRTTICLPERGRI